MIAFRFFKRLAIIAMRTLRRHRQYAVTLGELGKLDDRELQDIGVCRCDIQRIAWETACDDKR